MTVVVFDFNRQSHWFSKEKIFVHDNTNTKLLLNSFIELYINILNERFAGYLLHSYINYGIFNKANFSEWCGGIGVTNSLLTWSANWLLSNDNHAIMRTFISIYDLKKVMTKSDNKKELIKG